MLMCGHEIGIRSATWAVTDRCNFRCRHCCVEAGGDGQDMPLDACRIVVERLREGDVRSLVLTGGECFVRQDLEDILNLIAEEGLDLKGFLTNAAVIGEREASLVRRLFPHAIFQVSFDGVGYHDIMRGARGAEKATLKGIACLRKHGFRVRASMSICRANSSVVPKTVYRLEKLGVERILLNRVEDKGAWKANAERDGLSPSEFYDASLEWLRFAVRSSPRLELVCGTGWKLAAGDLTFPYRRFPLPCSLLSGIYIKHDGTVLPCSSFDHLTLPPLGNILSTSIGRIAANPLWVELCGMATCGVGVRNPRCRECRLKGSCGGGCRARGYMAEGAIDGADDEHCYLWRNDFEGKAVDVVTGTFPL